MNEYKNISEKEFWEKLGRGEKDFQKYDFDFIVDFRKISEINFELDFSKSIFRKEVFFSKTSFNKLFIIAKAIFESEVDFFGSTFKDDFIANSSVFNKNTIFNMVRFHNNVDFNKSTFKTPVYFKKTRFLNNLSFQKTRFLSKVDFSYSHFSSDGIVSFLSINDSRICPSLKIPLFIFKNILFPPTTIFNDVDLSRTVFQDSIIEDIIFKDCKFPQIEGRNSFYVEKPKIAKLSIDSGLLDELLNGETNTIIIDSNDPASKLCLSDRLIINDYKINGKETFFVVTKLEFNNIS